MDLLDDAKKQAMCVGAVERERKIAALAERLAVAVFSSPDHIPDAIACVVAVHKFAESMVVHAEDREKKAKEEAWQ